MGAPNSCWYKVSGENTYITKRSLLKEGLDDYMDAPDASPLPKDALDAMYGGGGVLYWFTGKPVLLQGQPTTLIILND